MVFKKLQKRGHAFQVPPQNTPLLWQLNSHKRIGSIPELLRCRTIIVVTLNLMYVHVFRLQRKPLSLLDDPGMCNHHYFCGSCMNKYGPRFCTYNVPVSHVGKVVTLVSI